MVSDKISQIQLFNSEECESIISLSKRNFQTWKSSDRQYKSEGILFNENTSWIFDRLKSFFEVSTGYELIKLKEEIHFHIFNSNSWFGIHTDSRDSRLFSVGVLLNENFQGGEFKLYTPNEIVLDKKLGNCYVFDANISHEITPITLGTRYSLIWFIQNIHIRTISTKLI